MSWSGLPAPSRFWQAFSISRLNWFGGYPDGHFVPRKDRLSHHILRTRDEIGWVSFAARFGFRSTVIPIDETKHKSKELML
jgi:hypothetical protein